MSVGVSSLDNCKTAGNKIFRTDKYDGRGIHYNMYLYRTNVVRTAHI